jgi:hypothetical protein
MFGILAATLFLDARPLGVNQKNPTNHPLFESGAAGPRMPVVSILPRPGPAGSPTRPHFAPQPLTSQAVAAGGQAWPERVKKGLKWANYDVEFYARR